MSFTQEEKADSLTVVNIDSPKEDKSNIQSQVEKIKADLNTIIQAMKKNKSVFSVLADFWGSKSWWLKIIIASTIVIPIIALAAVFQLYTLIGVGIAIAILYTGFSLLLDDHFSKDKAAIEELEKGVFALADLLINIINDLDKVREDLTKEVERFLAENIKLEISIQTLTIENKNIHKQLEIFKTLNEALKATNLSIKASEKNLAALLEKEQELFARSEAQWQESQKEYNKSLEHLQEKIGQLRNINSNLEEKMQELQDKCEILLDNNQKLALLGLEQESKQADYYGQLSQVLQNKDQELHKGVDKFNNAASTMQKSADQFKDTLAESQRLLTQGLQRGSLFEKKKIDLSSYEVQLNAQPGS